MDFDKLFNILNEIIDKEGYLTTVRTTDLSKKLLETLEIINGCDSCENNVDDEFYESINEIEYYLVELEGEEEEREKEEIINELNSKLSKIDDELNSEILCRSYKRDIKKLTNECGNKQMARFLYQCKVNAEYEHIRWTPFNEFKNIEYLAKGNFGEVHKASWIDETEEVVLKRIYNSSNKISDILKEVKKLIYYSLNEISCKFSNNNNNNNNNKFKG